MSTIALEIKGILETTGSIEGLSIFYRAMRRTNLFNELKKRGPFTIFAPADQAFDDLPEMVARDLFDYNDDCRMLTDVLSYHIIRERATALELTRRDELKTLYGEKLSVTFKYGKILIDSARVVEPDIECTNGVIHIIDVVALPERIGLKI